MTPDAERVARLSAAVGAGAEALASAASAFRELAQLVQELAEGDGPLAEVVELPKPRDTRTTAQRVRDAVLTFDGKPFAITELSERAGLTRSPVHRELKVLLARGVVEQGRKRKSKPRSRGVGAGERRGGRPSITYRYVPVAPENGRERSTGGEVQDLPRAKPVPGTGTKRAPRKDVGDLIARCRAAGAEVEATAGGHYKVKVDGKVVGGIPGTPSDRRWLANARADLRRAGVNL